MTKRRGRPPKKKPDQDSIEPKQESSIPQDLLDRAKKIGISDAQVKSLQTAESLNSFCDVVSPSTNPDAMPKAEPVKVVESVVVDDTIIQTPFDVSKDDIRAEIREIERIIRKLNIKHNTPRLSKISKTVVYDCKTRQIVSAKYEIEQ